MPASRLLVLFAHPAPHHSRVQRQLARAVRGLEGVTFHDLYEAYPDFDVDVRREQTLLAAHDLYVLQHPLYWYSVPALLKQWFDLVLEHGWAYGHGGTALHGKSLISALSVGGSEAAYRAEGANGCTLRQFLAPIEQSARLCGIQTLPPFVVYGTHTLGDAAIEGAARDYARLLTALRDGRLDLDAVRRLDRLDAAVLGAG